MIVTELVDAFTYLDPVERFHFEWRRLDEVLGITVALEESWLLAPEQQKPRAEWTSDEIRAMAAQCYAVSDIDVRLQAAFDAALIETRMVRYPLEV